MFALQPKPTFKSEVTIKSPDGEGKIKFEFKHRGKSALKEFFEPPAAGEKALDDADLILDMAVGWEGVDEKFSPEAVGKLVDNYPSATKSVFDEYIRALVEGGQKNSVK